MKTIIYGQNRPFLGSLGINYFERERERQTDRNIER
jgi:hypothetical protein